MNARLCSLGLGATVGFAASLARTPLAASLLDGPVAAPFDTALWRATPFLAAAVGVLLAGGGKPIAPIALAWGGALGFALHALVLSPWLSISSTGGLAALFVATTALAWLAARGPRSESDTETPGALRVAGLALAAAAAVVALEVAARPLRQFGSSADEQTIFASAFVACFAIGAAAFAGLFRGERAKGALPVLLVVASVGVWVSLTTISEIRTRDGLDAFLRTALLGLAPLDLSRRAMLDADFLIGARVLVVPAFAWGAALACVRHPRELAGLALGAALGFCGVHWLASGGPIDGETLARISSFQLERVAVVAAVGAVLASIAQRKLVASALAIALAAAAWVAPVRPTVVITPWDRFPAEPVLWVDHPVGLITVEPAPGAELTVTLDRRRLTAVGAELKAEEAQVATMWRALGLPSRGVRVLLIGQLSPERTQLLSIFGAERIDRTGAWWSAMPELEDKLFAGAPKPQGEVLSPSQARSRQAGGERTWDLIWMPATEAGVFDLPSRGSAERPIAVWQPIATYLADRALGAKDEWSRDVLLAGRGLDAVCFGFVDAGEGAGNWGGAERGVERLAAHATIAPPTPWVRLRQRAFQRRFDAETAAFARLAASDPSSKLASSLESFFSLQVASSPFETESQKIELDGEVLDRLRDVALEREPGEFVRRTWNWLAKVLTDKRDVTAILSHVEPIADRHPGWPALERALAAAYVESLDPETASIHFERAITAEPYDLTQYAPAAEAYLMANRPDRAVDLLRKALEIQPKRRDWERLLGVAQVRAGDRSGRELLQTLLLEDPDDDALIPYLSEPPFPDYQPLPAGGHDDH
ncbi:MAG: hypothetical protein IT453_16205 [Planctomycetes bacterium]|nr:hypothetical protein [Planctomycetota bacterium]